jgi:hypothetical protein
MRLFNKKKTRHTKREGGFKKHATASQEKREEEQTIALVAEELHLAEPEQAPEANPQIISQPTQIQEPQVNVPLATLTKKAVSYLMNSPSMTKKELGKKLKITKLGKNKKLLKEAIKAATPIFNEKRKHRVTQIITKGFLDGKTEAKIMSNLKISKFSDANITSGFEKYAAIQAKPAQPEEAQSENIVQPTQIQEPQSEEPLEVETLPQENPTDDLLTVESVEEPIAPIGDENEDDDTMFFEMDLKSASSTQIPPERNYQGNTGGFDDMVEFVSAHTQDNAELSEKAKSDLKENNWTELTIAEVLKQLKLEKTKLEDNPNLTTKEIDHIRKITLCEIKDELDTTILHNQSPGTVDVGGKRLLIKPGQGDYDEKQEMLIKDMVAMLENNHTLTIEQVATSFSKHPGLINYDPQLIKDATANVTQNLEESTILTQTAPIYGRDSEQYKKVLANLAENVIKNRDKKIPDERILTLIKNTEYLKKYDPEIFAQAFEIANSPEQTPETPLGETSESILKKSTRKSETDIGVAQEEIHNLDTSKETQPTRLIKNLNTNIAKADPKKLGTTIFALTKAMKAGKLEEQVATLQKNMNLHSINDALIAIGAKDSLLDIPNGYEDEIELLPDDDTKDDKLPVPQWGSRRDTTITKPVKAPEKKDKPERTPRVAGVMKDIKAINRKNTDKSNAENPTKSKDKVKDKHGIELLEELFKDIPEKEAEEENKGLLAELEKLSDEPEVQDDLNADADWEISELDEGNEEPITAVPEITLDNPEDNGDVLEVITAEPTKADAEPETTPYTGKLTKLNQKLEQLNKGGLSTEELKELTGRVGKLEKQYLSMPGSFKRENNEYKASSKAFEKLTKRMQDYVQKLENGELLAEKTEETFYACLAKLSIEDLRKNPWLGEAITMYVGMMQEFTERITENESKTGNLEKKLAKLEENTDGLIDYLNNTQGPWLDTELDGLYTAIDKNRKEINDLGDIVAELIVEQDLTAKNINYLRDREEEQTAELEKVDEQLEDLTVRVDTVEKTVGAHALTLKELEKKSAVRSTYFRSTSTIAQPTQNQPYINLRTVKNVTG